MRLMTSGPAGGGPEVVLDLLTSDLDLRAWVLSPTGRQIAGAGAPLPGPLGAALALPPPGRDPYRPPGSAPGGGQPARRIRSSRSGTPVGARSPAARDVRESVLSDWLLAVEADASDWPAARLDLLQGVTQLIAVERDRRDAARTVRRRLAQEVLELVQAGAAPAEIAARLRVAAPVLLPGLGVAPQWQVVVARVDWGATGQTAAAGDIASGPVAQALLEEILVDPAVSGPDSADRIAVAHTGEEAIALVPLPTPTTAAPGADEDASGEAARADVEDADALDEEPGLHADALLASVREPLSAGLADDGRLTLGVSAAVHSAEGLRGALEEARHARRVAAARPGRVCAAGHHELASHVLLLPFVPDDVRRAFTARLLDPLRDYDRRHRAELIETLEAFLDCDGSWTRCAARLHLHVNTLRYRVGRIEQLTGRDLSRLEDKLDFFLALRMS